MPIDYRDYHPQWVWISRQIRDQADQKCEFCGVANHAVGARDKRGRWHDHEEIDYLNSDEGWALFPDGYPNIITIVLTVAHLDHDKANNDPCNLRALCQRCHLNWDRDRHIANRRRNRPMREANKRGQLAIAEMLTAPGAGPAPTEERGR